MGLLLHCSFQASFSDGKLRCLNLAQHGFVPLVGALEYFPGLKISLSASAAWLEQLEKKTFAVLNPLIEAKRVEIFNMPYATPSTRWSTAEGQRAKLELSRELWQEIGVRQLAGIYDPESGRVELGRNGAVFQTERERAELADRVKTQRKFSLREADGKIVTIELSPDDIFPEQMSALEARNALLDLLKDLRRESAGLMRLSADFAAEHPEKAVTGGGAVAPAPSTVLPQFGYLAARLDELTAEVLPLPAKIKTMAKEVHNEQRLRAAERALAAAQAADLWRPENLALSGYRRTIVDYILRAQVEVDTITHPDTDPMIGWVTHRVAETVAVDTQLMRMYFDPQSAGSLIEFDYKPRKTNLTGAYHPQGVYLSFVDGLLDVSPGGMKAEQLPELNAKLSPLQGDKAEALVTKHSKDLFGLRLIRAAGGVRWVKHYAIKAGIGAHLSNSTTGLSFEYWLEADKLPSESILAAHRFSFALPSGGIDGASLRPLSAVGGESEKVFPLSSPLLLRTGDIEGGLYGGRLIDGIGNFVMDLRSAKPLVAFGCFPLFYETPAGEECGGVVMLFFLEAKRVFQDDKANTIFLSIR